MTEKDKIYFVSDIHLGAPALNDNREREILFGRWLDEIKKDAAGLYLMGDVFDYWFEYKHVIPKGFSRILGRLADITDQGIPVWFFAGNHDLWIDDYFQDELGITVHKKEVVETIKGKKFFLAHGDGLDASDKGYLFLKKIFTSRTLHWLYSRLHPNFSAGLALRWSKASRLSKLNSSDDFEVKKEGMYKFAVNFLETEKVDYFIFGHRHRMTDIPVGENSRFVLLGDWIRNFSYGVFDGEKFELKKYKVKEDSLKLER